MDKPVWSVRSFAGYGTGDNKELEFSTSSGCLSLHAFFLNVPRSQRRPPVVRSGRLRPSGRYYGRFVNVG